MFSGHGGDGAPLAGAVETLRARAAPAKLTVVHGSTCSIGSGKRSELVTSIIATLRPDAIRRTVGEPSAASADRGEAYLDAWTSFLIARSRDRGSTT